jgi:hypothetical protein
MFERIVKKKIIFFNIHYMLYHLVAGDTMKSVSCAVLKNSSITAGSVTTPESEAFQPLHEHKWSFLSGTVHRCGEPSTPSR